MRYVFQGLCSRLNYDRKKSENIMWGTKPKGLRIATENSQSIWCHFYCHFFEYLFWVVRERYRYNGSWIFTNLWIILVWVCSSCLGPDRWPSFCSRRERAKKYCKLVAGKGRPAYVCLQESMILILLFSPNHTVVSYHRWIQPSNS